MQQHPANNNTTAGWHSSRDEMELMLPVRPRWEDRQENATLHAVFEETENDLPNFNTNPKEQKRNHFSNLNNEDKQNKRGLHFALLFMLTYTPLCKDRI